MKFFKKSKDELQKFKENIKSFYNEFRIMQYDYFKLLVKKDKTDIEKENLKKLRKENFRLSVFLTCLVAPVPFIVTSYFIIVPRKYWPFVLKRIIKFD